jgi:hypothetical protein
MIESVKKYIEKVRVKFPVSVFEAIKRATLHWTGGLWFQSQWERADRSIHKPYHLVYTWNKGKAKRVQTRSIGVVGEHVWKRNSGNLGLSFAAMGRDRYGKVHAVQKEQIELMAKDVAELAILFGWDLAAKSEDVQGHYYWAAKDGYGPGSGHPETRVDPIGYDDDVRRKAIWYRAKLEAGEVSFELLPVLF